MLMWNMDYYFLSKKDREVKFKTVFYQDTLPNDFISMDDVSAGIPTCGLWLPLKGPELYIKYAHVLKSTKHHKISR